MLSINVVNDIIVYFLRCIKDWNCMLFRRVWSKVEEVWQIDLKSA